MISSAIRGFFRPFLFAWPRLLCLAITPAVVAQQAESDDETEDAAALQAAEASESARLDSFRMLNFELKPIASLICDIKDFPWPEPTEDDTVAEDNADVEPRQLQLANARLMGGSTVIRTNDEFAKLWKKSPWNKNQKPKVDFESSILLVHAYNSGDTSQRGGWRVLVTADGNMGAAAMYMTKEAWTPTGQFRVLFFAVPKQEVDEFGNEVDAPAEENNTSDDSPVMEEGESQSDPSGDEQAAGEDEPANAEAEAWANSMFVANGRRMAIIGVVPFANLTCIIKDFPKFEPSEDETDDEAAREDLTEEQRAGRNSKSNAWPFGGRGAEFRNSEEFDKWWKKTPWEEKQKPKVDFEKSLLVVCAHNDGVPNSCSFVVRITEEGTAGIGISSMTKQAGFTVSNNYRVWFFAVPRKTIEEFARSAAATGENAADTQANKPGGR